MFVLPFLNVHDRRRTAIFYKRAVSKFKSKLYARTGVYTRFYGFVGPDNKKKIK